MSRIVSTHAKEAYRTTSELLNIVHENLTNHLESRGMKLEDFATWANRQGMTQVKQSNIKKWSKSHEKHIDSDSLCVIALAAVFMDKSIFQITHSIIR